MESRKQRTEGPGRAYRGQGRSWRWFHLVNAETNTSLLTHLKGSVEGNGDCWDH